MFNFFVFQLVWFVLYKVCNTSDINIQIADGKLRGSHANSRNGRQYSAFMGIPYANQPSAFEVAESVAPWNGTLDASKYGSVCTQFDIRVQKIMGSENCLFVNVFSPNVIGHFPVLVFIHGGGFQFGNSDENGPDYLMDENIVLVTLNYRLGPFGFLSSGDEILPGNYGLKDQTLALKWIKKNIINFGGNSNSVTIYGESAGAASVSLHILSPLSKGLFHKAICVSGTALAEWAISRNPRTSLIALAKKLNCPGDTSFKMKNCIKERSIAEIYTPERTNLSGELSYVPAIEPISPNAFLTEYPKFIYAKGNLEKIPLLIMVNEDEGLLIYSAGIMKDFELTKQLNENWFEMAPNLLYYQSYSSQAKEKISKAILNFYFKNQLPATAATFQNLTNVFSDTVFIYSSRQLAIEHGKFAPTFVAVLGFQGIWSQIFTLGYDKFLGMTHADDLQYAFSDIKYPKFEIGSDVMAASEKLIKTITSFATNGNPNYDLTQSYWDQLSPDEINTGVIDWMYMRNKAQHKDYQQLQSRMKFLDAMHQQKFQEYFDKTEL